MADSGLSRRAFLGRGAGALLLTFVVGGCEKKMTPGEAARDLVPLRTLTETEAATLGGLCEALVPGASEAGVVQYIDHQLAGPAAESMLMIKYLGVPAPFMEFYRKGLQAIEDAVQKRYGKVFATLRATELKDFVSELVAGKLPDWPGPPQPFLYFVLRTDAIDVTYGTEQGFAALDVPYMPHIAPPSNWGA